MKFILLSLLISLPAFSANKKSWVPKYEKEHLSNLRTKIKPAKTENIVKVEENLVELKSFDVNDLSQLEKLYATPSKKKEQLAKLKEVTLKFKQQAVPLLTRVMKENSFPDENRWIATFMLGRIMGVKSSEYISKFSKHPNWMLRLASLKVLLHLNQTQYVGIYSRLLEDTSLIVRHQALQNIREMKLTSLAPFVWKMLYNKENYVGQQGGRKRANIIKDAIKVVGELGLEKAKKPMLTMIRKSKYKDIHTELDYSLSKLHSKPSPNGSIEIKKNFWTKVAMSETTI